MEEARAQELEPSQDHPRLVSNSQSVESQDSLSKADTQKELVLVPQSISPQSLSTSLLRSSNSPVTPPRTTRSQESCQDTFNSPSETTRSSTSSWPTQPLLTVVSSPTSTSSSSQERARVKRVMPHKNYEQTNKYDVCD